MKKILYVSALFVAISGYAQKNQIKFDNLLQYSFKSSEREISDYESFKTNVYFSSTKKASLFEFNSNYQSNSMAIVKGGKMISIASIGLDRIIKTPNAASYTFPTMQSTGETLGGNANFVSMNKKGNFNGISCDYYTLTSQDVSEASYSDNQVCFCVDTTNKTKNLKAIFPNSNIDGLVLAYGNSENLNDHISLDAIKKVDLSIDFDFDSEYKKLENEYTEYLAQFEETEVDTAYATTDVPVIAYDDYYNDPLCNNYEYFNEVEEKAKSLAYQFKDIACSLKNADSDYDGTPDMERKQAIVIAKKQAEAFIKQAKKEKVLSKAESKSLNNAFEKMFEAADKYVPTKTNDEGYVNTYPAEVDSVAWDAAAYPSEAYTKYVSNYKMSSIEPISLAAESQIDANISEYMPNYCAELKANIPEFKNATLKKHVYNLVGQICDLYLYQNGGEVAYFVTIDSMRKSLLEIENLRGELSKSDAKLLKEYLNSLD